MVNAPLTIAQQLALALEPSHPSLVLSIDAGATEVQARIYQGDEPFEMVNAFYLEPTFARSQLQNATRLEVDAEGVDEDVFNVVLTSLEAGIVVKPRLPDHPTCSIGNLTDLVNGMLAMTESVVVQIGPASWRVVA